MVAAGGRRQKPRKKEGESDIGDREGDLEREECEEGRSVGWIDLRARASRTRRPPQVGEAVAWLGDREETGTGVARVHVATGGGDRGPTGNSSIITSWWDIFLCELIANNPKIAHMFGFLLSYLS
jgi:hypothetical protein